MVFHAKLSTQCAYLRIISSPKLCLTNFRLLTVQCYGPYTARDGVCKFNGTVTSQCPSGYGVPKVYKAKDAYAVAQLVSLLWNPMSFSGVNYLFVVSYSSLNNVKCYCL